MRPATIFYILHIGQQQKLKLDPISAQPVLWTLYYLNRNHIVNITVYINHKYIYICSLNPLRKEGKYTANIIQNSKGWCARDGYHNYRHIFNELLNLNAKVTNIELEKGEKKKNSKAKTCWNCWTYAVHNIILLTFDCNSMSSMTA